MAALLARRERDGLSLRELSDESGIPLGTLSWWSWRLRHVADARAVDSDSGSPNAGGFVELVAAAACHDHDVVVRLGEDLMLEVRVGTDASWLRYVVAALRSC